MHPYRGLIPGLLGLALAVSSSAGAVAHEPGAPASSHDHKGLMGWKSCVECQRARALSRDGVNVPPPPSTLPPGASVQHLPPGAAVQHLPPGATIQHIGHDAHDGHVHAGEVIIEEGAIVLEEGQVLPPGRAVVGGGQNFAATPPGRAVVGGPEPAPVGVSRASEGNFTPVGNVAASGPLRDSSITPTSIPPAQTAIGGATSSRPRVISHLLGLPDLRRLRKDRQAYLAREGHASIPYGDQSAPVTDLPASMVYDKGR